MIKYLIKYRALAVTVLAFMPLLFLFFSSEIGQANVKVESQAADSYCYVMKNVTVQSVKVLSDFPQLKLESSFCFHCIQEQVTNEILTTVFEYNDFLYPQKTSELYLHNRVFLI